MEVVDQLSQLLEETSPDSLASVPQDKSKEALLVTAKKKGEKEELEEATSKENLRIQVSSKPSALSHSTVATTQNKDEGKKKKSEQLILCTVKTRYVVIKKAWRQLGHKTSDDESQDWDLYWCDTGGVTPEQLQRMQPYQRINHFPGMYQLARKSNLCRNLIRMQKVFKDDYNIFPKTWILPSELSDFKQQFNKKKPKTFIIKPAHMCQGRGIFLVRKFEDIDLKPNEQYVAQRYLHKPYLIDNLKFDLRVYALVYGVDPLRVFVYQEGLARFATEEYVGPQNGNLENLFMHLTNYAINKNSENFIFNEDYHDDSSGHKRSLTAVLEHIKEHEPECDAEKLWEQIQDIIAKTVISVQPTLQHAYRSAQPEDLENSMCFEVLGFDIILDHKLRPMVLEVNHASSFGTDSPLDKKIKLDLMKDTFTLLNLSVKRKKQLKKEKAENFSKRVMGEKGLSKYEKEQIRKRNQQARDEFDLNNLGNYKLVFPVLDNKEKAKRFDQYLMQSQMLWQEFTGGSKISSTSIPQIKQANINANSNRARTDPPGVKSKAHSLQQAYQKQSNNQLVARATEKDKVFFKRNTIFTNRAAIQQEITQSGFSQAVNSHIMRNTGSEFNKTISAQHNHNLSNILQSTDNMITSPMKQDTLDHPHLIQTQSDVGSPGKIQPEIGTSFTPQPMQHHTHHVYTGNSLVNFDFGISTTNLIEAIHKRFPMVRLEQSSQNYGAMFSPGINSNSNINQSGSKIKTKAVSVSRQSYPVNNQIIQPSEGQGVQRVKPFILNAFNSNENGQTSASTALSISQHHSNINQSASKTFHSSALSHKKNSLKNTNQNNFYIQNQNMQLIQNMERYNMLKHIEAVKRSISFFLTLQRSTIHR